MNSPVILGVSEGAAKYMGGYITVYNLVKGLIEDRKITIPVCLHLDHGKSYEACKNAIDAGFTSVMIDASASSLQENIDTTKQVVIYAHSKNVTVEAEVGHIGGSEDSSASDIAYANLEDCINLVNNTGIDSLAPPLGSVHGLYNGEARIDLERMAVIRDNINMPLVLHGGTGISDQVISQSIKTGICKININTELQVAWAKAVREKIKNDLNVYDPRKIIGSGEQALKDSVREKILLFESNNRY
jgi:fructose-bisphosphate aldolase class II